MGEADRAHWDARYKQPGPTEPGLSEVFAPYLDLFPTTGVALDIACGRGAAAVWLARRGMSVTGVDVSPVAMAQARALADAHGVRCRFEVVDLDDGLPPGPPLDVVVCQRFRDARLDAAIVDRLTPGGLLAISALSEVGAGPGRFRVPAGELVRAFAGLTVEAAGEADGLAWLLARRVV
ncbi:SAM-dependent methyltransferase [Mycobacterium sp. djl-10]|nr:SAM-dependent methyltransferase [Mycobacterium sp. djl-10]